MSSVEVIKVDAQSLFDVIVDMFTTHDIPWTNLISVLMDSCSVMRGSKSGLETRVREKANHLSDIDGDSCHHIHNGSKKFCQPFSVGGWKDSLETCTMMLSGRVILVISWPRSVS